MSRRSRRKRCAGPHSTRFAHTQCSHVPIPECVTQRYDRVVPLVSPCATTPPFVVLSSLLPRSKHVGTTTRLSERVNIHNSTCTHRASFPVVALGLACGSQRGESSSPARHRWVARRRRHKYRAHQSGAAHLAHGWAAQTCRSRPLSPERVGPLRVPGPQRRIAHYACVRRSRVLCVYGWWSAVSMSPYASTSRSAADGACLFVDRGPPAYAILLSVFTFTAPSPPAFYHPRSPRVPGPFAVGGCFVFGAAAWHPLRWPPYTGIAG